MLTLNDLVIIAVGIVLGRAGWFVLEVIIESYFIEDEED